MANGLPCLEPEWREWLADGWVSPVQLCTCVRVWMVSCGRVCRFRAPLRGAMAALGLGVRGFGSQFGSGAASSEGMHVRRADCNLLAAWLQTVCCVVPACVPLVSQQVRWVHWRAGRRTSSASLFLSV